MALKSHSILLFLSLMVLISFNLSSFDVSATNGDRKVVANVGWQQIKNLTAPELQDLARFAITEHNKQAKANLVFQSLDKGETMIVDGTDYRFSLTAKDGGARPGHYLAIVWVKPWLHYRNLTTFEKFLG